MRILTRKIWRAFPELDKYEDDVCRRYTKHARALRNAWKGAALVLGALLIAWVVWGVLTMLVVGRGMKWITPSDGVETFIALTIMTGFVWFPVFWAFLVRDRWLNRCVRKHIADTACAECGYTLIGLAFVEFEGKQSVLCPECGRHTKLEEWGLVEADIDPTLLTKD